MSHRSAANCTPIINNFIFDYLWRSDTFLISIGRSSLNGTVFALSFPQNQDVISAQSVILGKTKSGRTREMAPAEKRFETSSYARQQGCEQRKQLLSKHYQLTPQQLDLHQKSQHLDTQPGLQLTTCVQLLPPFSSFQRETQTFLQ